MTMISLLGQLPVLDIPGHGDSSSNNNHKCRQTPPARFDERDDLHDIEDGGSLSSDDCFGNGTTSTSSTNSNATIRSRVKGGRSTSPTGSTISMDDGDWLPLLHQDSSDSEDSAERTPEPMSSKAPPALCTRIVEWIKLLGLAVILSTFIYNLPGMTMETIYFPSHGRGFSGGLKSITSTPTFHYEPTDTPQLDEHNEVVHIPRIVHVTYKSREELPPAWQYSISQWENTHPDWEVRFWSDKDIEEFVHKEFPELEALHKSYKYMIQRVDSVRYMILYHFGGVYSDMDIYPATNLDKLLQQWEDAGKNVLLAETTNMGVTNAFMASAKESSFMGCVIDNLPRFQHGFHHWMHWQHWEVLSTAGSNYLWGMVGHCQDEGVEVLAARSFRGCSVCDAWETGQPAETCDTQWFHHSSTNSSWHEQGNLLHSLFMFFSYSYLCSPRKACFLTVTALLILIKKRRAATTVIPRRRFVFVSSK